MYEDLKEYAKVNKVPIILDDSLEVILNIIKENNIKTILELGTAIAYSAIRMAELGVFITTLERNPLMYNEAIKNIHKYNLENQIEAVFMDALEYTPTIVYDLIFIDASKAQNIKFIERYSPCLNKGGLIIVDNINFHGVDVSDPSISKNLRSMVKKINLFKDWIKENKDFETYFLDTGDGLSISKKL